MSHPLRFYEADGHRIAVRVFNEKRRGRPLVALHGVASSLNIWPDMLPAALRERPWFAVGLPAHYPSRAPRHFTRQPMGLDLFASRLPGVMTGILGRRSFDLLGHSAGGFAALCIAAQMPRQVNSLCLVSAFAHGELRGSLGRMQKLSRLRGTGPAFAATHMLYSRTATVAGWAAAQAAGNRPAARRWLRSHPAFAATLADARQGKPADIRHFLSQMSRYDISDRLRHIQAPALIVHGSADSIVKTGHARLLQRRIPGAQLRIMKDIGHLPFAEDAPQFEQVLADWYGYGHTA